MTDDRVLVIGASGYVGARLVTRLLEQGYRVRAAGRSRTRLALRPWADDGRVELREADVLNVASLEAACNGCSAVYYLVHSMTPGGVDFADLDRRAAENMTRAAATSGVGRIVYLGGLGDEDKTLSKHLRSRIEVGRILQSGPVPATVLRAAMIIGAGSASFEILRYLVDRLPVMITPKWVRTECQPIAIADVLGYLTGCLTALETAGQTFDIGGPEVVTYRHLMTLYAREAGLAKRLIIPVPVLTPRLSSYWIHLVTPLHASIGRPLAEGLSSRVVCQDDRITELVPRNLLGCRDAIRLALSEATATGPDGALPPAEWSCPGDPEWAGGTHFADSRRIVLHATPDEVWHGLARANERGRWFTADILWRIRGGMDRMIGGPGLRNECANSGPLRTGDVIDSWHVARVDPPKRLHLVSEMRLPGRAELEFRVRAVGDCETELVQTARFRPRGLFGLVYWYAVLPIHQIEFNRMLLIAANRIGRLVISSPEPCREDG